jgi:hypothetical protein
MLEKAIDSTMPEVPLPNTAIISKGNKTARTASPNVK